MRKYLLVTSIALLAGCAHPGAVVGGILGAVVLVTAADDDDDGAPAKSPQCYIVVGGPGPGIPSRQVCP